MRKIEIELYQYNELSAEAKEKAKEWFNSVNDMPFLSDDIRDFIKTELKQHNIVGEPNVMYSLSYCQGDGVMFEGVFTFLGATYTVKHSGHYYHEKSKVIDSDAAFVIQSAFNGIYENICRKAAKYGYEQIEHAQSEESVADAMEANEYEFTKGGERFDA